MNINYQTTKKDQLQKKIKIFLKKEGIFIINIEYLLSNNKKAADQKRLKNISQKEGIFNQKVEY